MVQTIIGKVAYTMLITAIQIRRIENSETKMQGIVTITLNEMIAIHDIKVLKNGDSMFLAMPSRATKSNTFKDVVHPINSDVRTVFERLVFAAYEMADSMKCGHLELILKEEKRSLFFLIFQLTTMIRAELQHRLCSKQVIIATCVTYRQHSKRSNLKNGLMMTF